MDGAASPALKASDTMAGIGSTLAPPAAGIFMSLPLVRWEHAIAPGLERAQRDLNERRPCKMRSLGQKSQLRLPRAWSRCRLLCCSRWSMPPDRSDSRPAPSEHLKAAEPEAGPGQCFARPT